MSTSYSEISGGDLFNSNPNYEVMDVSEDIIDDENERDRPDSFSPLENEGQRKLKINQSNSTNNLTYSLFHIQLKLMKIILQ
jgi:hypothetical protein